MKESGYDFLNTSAQRPYDTFVAGGKGLDHARCTFRGGVVWFAPSSNKVILIVNMDVQNKEKL